MTKRYSVSFVHKAVTAFLGLFFLFPLVTILAGIEASESWGQNLAFAVLGGLFAVLFYLSFQSYSFSDDGVEVKLPFFRTKLIPSREITGWYTNPGSTISTYTFVTAGSSVTVFYSGKLRKALDAFVESHADEWEARSYEILQAHGTTIYGLFSRPLYRVGPQGLLEVKTGHLIPWDQVEDIRTTSHGTAVGYEVVCGKTLRFTNLGARGCPGLTRFLRDQLA